jgi:hypothetical protein
VFLALAPGAAFAADEIHWSLFDSTSVTFNWRGPGDTLRYGLTPAYGSVAVGRAPVPLPFSSAGPFYRTFVPGLLPGVTYHYSIGGGSDHVFRSAPAPGTGFTVYVEADVGDRVTYPNVGAVQSLIADGQPDWVLVVGDLTYGDDHGQAAVDEHFDDVMLWSENAAYMPAWGNHEWEDPSDDLRNYKGRFMLPNAHASVGAPAAGCCGEDWYWFDYGGVRFINYPEPYPGAWADWFPQAKALMDEAESNPTIRTIVTFGHRPAYSSGEHPGDPEIQADLDTLGATHTKYVLNLNGHSHDYERSTPQHGVTHVTVGIGGSMMEQESGPCLWLGGCPPPPWSAYRAFHHGALRLRFGPDHIEGDAICGPAGDVGGSVDDIVCASGDAFDSFVLGGDLAPIVKAPAHENGHVGIPFVVHVEARDPDGEPIQSLTADLSALPPEDGATFQVNPGDSLGTLTWTPDMDDTSTYVVTFRAQNKLVATATTTMRVTDAVGASPPSVTTFALESALPNPARTDLAIVYRVPDTAPVRLELANTVGRVVLRRDLGSPGPGQHTIQLDALPQAAGIYWLRLIRSHETQIAKIALIR